jgi:ribA/ribD-fused uncharacterized protein
MHEPITSFENEFAFLSNFFHSPITYEGIKYPTVEAAFQAAKTFNESERKMIAAAETPGKAKRMGRKVQLRADWEQVKDGIMEELVRLKFTSSPTLAIQLWSTGDRELVEGNWWNDTYWGVCDGVGRNQLGKTLMKIRTELKIKAEMINTLENDIKITDKYKNLIS